MKIFLLRHAQAAAAYPDASRPLTEIGQAHAGKLARFVAGSGQVQPTAIWRSPYLRAQQTAEILIDQLKLSSVPLSVREDLTPESNPQAVFGDLAEQSADLLIVGHNPHLSILASLLLGGERGRVRLDLQTCNLICLEWFPFPNYGETGPCALSWLLDPRLL